MTSQRRKVDKSRLLVTSKQASKRSLIRLTRSERRGSLSIYPREERGCSRESNNHYSTPSKHHPLNKAPNNNMHFSVLLGCLTLQQSEPALCSQTRKLATKQSLNTPHSLPLADRKGAHASLPVLERRRGGEALLSERAPKVEATSLGSIEHAQHKLNPSSSLAMLLPAFRLLFLSLSSSTLG